MEDTIAAISSAVGEAGIGIVRMSGPKSLDVACKVFKGKKVDSLRNVSNRRLTYGYILDPESNKKIDEVLIVYMKAPYTYTREDVVEIYCHGGIISVRRILEVLLDNGARLAEPGEFTKRAFLNGRLDLSQAEAVIDVIRAKTDTSFDVSLGQLEGTISKSISNIMNILLGMLAHIEASIDFPEDELEEVTYDELLEEGNKVLSEIDKLLNTSDRGKILREGLNTVILGKPNVGKSSLLNALLRENRAIVTNVPGTTRDIIEEYINIDGIPLKIVDTAGIRDTKNLIEKIGVDKAKEMVDKADLVIAVFDASRELSSEDFRVFELIENKKAIILFNKTDLPNVYDISKLENLAKGKKVISTSISEGKGIELVEDTIKEMFYSGDVYSKDDVIITNVRHKKQLEKAKDSICDAIEGIKSNVPLDCVEVDIRSCWESLGEISGDVVSEDIIDKIFSEFCIGK